MAGSNQKNTAKRQGQQRARVVPNVEKGSSRVSSAAGDFGPGMQSVHVEQRSNASSVKQGARRSSSPKQAARSKQGGAKKSRRPASPSVSSAPDNTKDIQFTQWMLRKWSSMQPHHQQRFFGIILLILSLLLFGALTIFRTSRLLGPLNKVLLDFCGWGAYPLSIGLIAFALVHLIEGMRNQHIMTWRLVIGLGVLWLLLLAESRLLFGSVGILGELLVSPLLGWSPLVGHVVLLGLLIVVAILTFRIRFGHVLMLTRFMQRLISDNPGTDSSKTPAPSPYLGQRPQYSRYVGTAAASSPSASRQGTQSTARSRKRSLEDEEEHDDANFEDEDATIAFEADFPEDDPLDDINIHKTQVGTVPRGPRAPRAIDVANAPSPVYDANQQALPFDEEANAHKLILKAAKNVDRMESLPPNPRLAKGTKAQSAAVANTPNLVSPWKVPDTSLLNNPEEVKMQMLGDDTSTLARTIQETLRSFRVDAEVRPEDISIGPTIIRFGIRPTGKPEMKLDEKTGKMVPVKDPAGNIIYEVRTRVSRIMALQNDLALVLEAKNIRMEAPVPGRPYVGVEIPNKNSRLVTLREVLESKEYLASKAKSKLSVALGKDVGGLVRIGDLARMPHLLIAGATGAGKSVCINTIIASILTQATPDDVRMLMVDPKMVELNMYNGIPHLLSPVVTEVDRVVPLLKNAITEMERRYRLFSQLNVRNLDGYRKLRLEKITKGDTSLNNLPAIVIIIDELADLMMAAPEEVEGMICRLAQLARATGIHLVIATQRPSVDVITGLIKANIPTRISFMVSSSVDSRTIIDMGGAERLLGRGDMLYLPADAGRPERIQCSFLADEEAERLVIYWQQQIIDHARVVSEGDDPNPAPIHTAVEPGWEIKDEPSSDEFELDDDLLDKAEEIVRDYGRASISLLQRRLRIGYSRAARLIDLLEEHGIIGHSESGGRAREILDGGYERHGDDGGQTMADEVADIVAEEKARDEFLRKQANRRSSSQQNHSAQRSDEEI
ncbi:MAG TPA: DNA translocase FtsK [Ktedonobacteraceae bacterium]